MEKVNIAEKLAKINDHYVPRVAAELNGQYIKLVKFVGPYPLHKHDNEDEMFLVLKGSFDMVYEDRRETINEGEFVIIPKGVIHGPDSKEEVAVMLFEPKTVVNTGDAGGGYTIKPEDLERI